MIHANFTAFVEVHAGFLSQACDVHHWYAGVIKGDAYADEAAVMYDVSFRDVQDQYRLSVDTNDLLQGMIQASVETGKIYDFSPCVVPDPRKHFVCMIQDYATVYENEVQIEPLNGYSYICRIPWGFRVWLRVLDKVNSERIRFAVRSDEQTKALG